LLGYVTGLVNQELLLRNEYLVAENCILKARSKGRLRLLEGEKARLAQITKRLGRKALADIAGVAKPETLLAWYRKLVAQKLDDSKRRGSLGRPRLDRAIEELVVKLALENCSWGYNRINGAMANVGHVIFDPSVGNILLSHGIPPAPERKKNTTWQDFISAHMSVLAGTDFFTAEGHVARVGDPQCAVLCSLG
jgi:putative transposase